MNHKCPVCGYPKLEEAPRTQAGGGSYEICPSCGFQFGVSDDDRGFTYARVAEKMARRRNAMVEQTTLARGMGPSAATRKSSEKGLICIFRRR